MKQWKRMLGIGALCAALVAIVVLMYTLPRAPRSAFNGSSVRGNAQFTLDVTEMNGQQSHTIKLEQGGMLQCKWVIEHGTVGVLIAGDNGEKLYQGDRVDRADFIVIAENAGEYTITVTGEHAKGYLDFRKTDKKNKR